jgi:hypothetical protein
MQKARRQAGFLRIGLAFYHRQRRRLVRRRRGIRRDRARAVIASKLLNPEDSGAGAVLRLLDLRSVKFHLVTNLDGGRVAFERVGLSVTGLQFEPTCAARHAPGHDVMAVVDGKDDRDRDCRTDANRSTCDLAAGWTNPSATLTARR